MSRRAASVLLSAIAAPAFLMLFEVVPAQAAAACNAAPKSPPPQDSHWYYRTDRASGRKCWYLAAAGQKIMAAPRQEARARAEAVAPATMDPSAEQLTRQAGLRLTEPAAPPAGQADAIVSTAAPAVQAPDRPGRVAELREEPASLPAAQERATEDAQVFRSLEERLTQLPASTANVADISAASSMSISRFAPIALGAICLLASAGLCVAAARRRRAQMPIQIVDLSARVPVRMPVAVGTAPAPRRAPADADIKIDEERLRQFARAWKQQAA